MLSSTSGVTRRSDRHKTEKQRNAEILHGHGGKIADENGHDELGRVHLSELALSISRTAQMTAKYSTSVRTRGTDMKPPPFQKYAVIV